jgi:hypothetical protein
MIHLTVVLAAHHAHHAALPGLLRLLRWAGLAAIPAACRSCGTEDSPHWRLGWCNACYMRWCRAGRPASGPPPAQLPKIPGWFASRASAVSQAVVARRTAGRMEKIAALTAQGLTAQQIGWELRLSPRTVTRYRKAIAQSRKENPPVDKGLAPIVESVPGAPPEDYARCARLIAGYARDAAEALMFADMLGAPAGTFAAAGDLSAAGAPSARG